MKGVLRFFIGKRNLLLKKREIINQLLEAFQANKLKKFQLNQKNTLMSEQQSKNAMNSQELFFGPLGSAYVLQVKGDFIPFNSLKISHGSNNQANRQATVEQYGKYDQIIVPLPPAVSLNVFNKQQKPPQGEGELQLPLIKVTPKSQNISSTKIIPAIRSGRRSAIFFTQNKSYRLKGCGNDDQGFIVQNPQIPFLEETATQVRGSNFYHTAMRQILFSQKVDQILKAYKIPNANKPVGVWKYSQNFEESVENGLLQTQIRNQGKQIEKYCALFETLGQRRLATHLLQGLSQLLDLISEAILSNYENDNQKLLALLTECFPKQRWASNGALVENPMQTPKQKIVSSTQSQLKYFDPQGQEPKKTLKQWYESCPQGQIFNKDYNSLLVNANRFKQLVKELIKTQYLGVPANTLIKLYERIGLQVGTIQRALQDNEISWGYFFDHHPFLPHCNAHPNNIVIRAPPYENKTILAPLDQDLSYCWEEFVNIMKEDENYGKHDRFLFESWLNSQRHAMEEGLSGASNMQNFEYNTISEDAKEEEEAGLSAEKKEKREKLKKKKKLVTDISGLIELGFRELMILSFRSSFQKKVNTCTNQIGEEDAQELEKLIKMSIEIVIKEVAS